MRFTESGPNIPDELLYAQDEGNVVFFCGAGVSIEKVKLPSFTDLAKKVILDLKAAEDSKAAKLLSTFSELNEQPHSRGAVSADHIFSSLIRSFDRDDINCSVARSLFPEDNPDLASHKIMLRLAQPQKGKTRLITTNFDLLFEEANQSIASVTRSNLPNVKYTDNNWGIVHLHGKVKKDYSGPDNDGFVLSSSEFGEAYLAQGWARSFVKSVLRKFVAVFVGYSADDPPIRYLLEGMQQSGDLNNKIYAFQNTDEEAVAQWAEKGVTPIVYDLDNKGTHTTLWETLDSWGLRTKNPREWKKKILTKAKKGPAKLQAHERGMVAHLVKSASGAKAFQQANPPMPSEWLCVFDPTIRLKQVKKQKLTNEIINPRQRYEIDNDPPPSDRNESYSSEVEAWDAFLQNQNDVESLTNRQLPNIRNWKSSSPANLSERLHYLSLWIAKVSGQRIAVWWAGRQQSLHPDLIQLVKDALHKQTGVPKPINEAWSAIFELSNFYERSNRQEYEFLDSIKKFGWSNFLVREYSNVSAPFLKQGGLYSFSIPRDNREKISRHTLVKVDIDYPKGIYGIDVPDEYLSRVVNALRTNLERALSMKQDFLIWGDDICEIEQDETSIKGHHINYGLSGYVLNFVNLFRKLACIDLKHARWEFRSWSRTDKVFTRLRVWGSGLDGLLDEEEFTKEIMSLCDGSFWPFKGERDLLLTLKKKWNELSEQNRNQIEGKILKGPEKYSTESRENYVARSTHKKLCRLHWLSKNGCNLSLNLEVVTKELRAKAPEWNEEYAENAAKGHDFVGGIVETDKDWSKLDNLPLEEIIEQAKKVKGRKFQELVEHDPFSGFCDDRPLRAISALSLELKRGKFDEGFWETYLSRDARKNDSYRLKLLTAGRITQISDEDFNTILLTASRWFEDQGPVLREKAPRLFTTVWEKFIRTITKYHESSGSALVRLEGDEVDWVGEAINSSSGNLAELLITNSDKQSFALGEGFPKTWLSKVEQLFNLPNDAGRYAMVILCFNLGWLHAIDPAWTEKVLIKVIEDGVDPNEDSDAIWAGFMWGATCPRESLYLKLKPHLLRMASERATARKRHVEVLSGLLLVGWGSKKENNEQYISDEELHNTLLKAGDDFRSRILWHLQNWTKDKNNNWDSKLLIFLQEVWPRHKKVRTSHVSAQLCEIAFQQKNNFSVISKLVAQLVSKVGNEHLFIIQEVRRTAASDDKSNLAETYPEDYLNLLYKILPDKQEVWFYGAKDVLRIIEEAAPSLLGDPRLVELKERANDF